MSSLYRVLPAFLTLLSSYPTSCCLANMPEEEIEPFMHSEYVQDYVQEDAYFPSCNYASPYTCWGHASFSVDFLYWLFPSGSREIAASHVPTSAISTTGLTFLGDYEKHFISTKYKPGFRIGATYGLCCSDWALTALYTDFRPTFCNHLQVHNNNTAIIPVQMPEIFAGEFMATPTIFTSAHSRFRLTYRTLDLCLQYTPACLNTHCQMWEPYLGVRLLELNQDWKVHYNTTPTSSSPEMTLATQWKGKLPAIGATFGIKGNYRLCNGLSVIGRLGASCVQGKVKEHARYEALSTSDLELYKLHDHFSDIFTGWEGAIGLAYACEFPNISCCTAAFSIGYEVQSWWNMPLRSHDSLILPVNSWPSNLNFTLHGLFIRGTIFF